MQDASFITSDPGHAKSDAPTQRESQDSAEQVWNLGEEGGTKFYFGYELHGAMDEDFDLIRRIKVTTSKIHDSQADLANEGEVRYADKGYSGAKTKGYDAAMNINRHNLDLVESDHNPRLQHHEA